MQIALIFYETNILILLFIKYVKSIHVIMGEFFSHGSHVGFCSCTF